MPDKLAAQYSIRIALLLLILLTTACASPAANSQPVQPQSSLNPQVMLSTPLLPPQQPSTATPLPTPPPPRRPIYIVDPNDQGLLSNIFMVDPDNQRIVWTIQTRFLPDVALSPDGQRLYVADSYRTRVTRGDQQDVLSVYDAHSGELLVDDSPVQGRLLYKLLPLTRDPFIFFSDDGRRLFIEKYGDQDTHQLRLLTLDAVTLQPLHEGLLPSCGHSIVALSDRWICLNNAALYEINPLYNGGGNKSLLSLPGPSPIGVAFDPHTSRLYTLDASSILNVVDLKTKTVLERKQLEVAPGWVLGRDLVITPDGKRLFISLNTKENKDSFYIDALAVYYIANWEQVGMITPSNPIYHFVLSAAGDQLYATSPNARTLFIYDTASFQQFALIQDLGGTPSLILVPPSYR